MRGDDGWLMFPGLVGDEGGVVLEEFLPHGERVDGRTVFAGRVPEGVARVVVIDDRGDEYEATLGDEVWVAWRGRRILRAAGAFEDAAGVLVPRPLPDGPRTRVPTSTRPARSAERRVGRDRRGVHCERCGLQVGADMFIHRFSSFDYEDYDEEDADEDDEEDEWEAEERRERQPIPRVADVPDLRHAARPADRRLRREPGQGIEDVDAALRRRGAVL